jgi:hypothetical protein
MLKQGSRGTFNQSLQSQLQHHPLRLIPRSSLLPICDPHWFLVLSTYGLVQLGLTFGEADATFLNPDTIDEGTEVDLDGAVFATGRIGEWLFTGAYNSDRPLNETCDGITRCSGEPNSCEQQYPVYGDSSTVDYLTPSTDSVYLRFERTSPVPGAEPDYVMWGDYNTQEFTRGFSAIYGNNYATARLQRELQLR